MSELSDLEEPISTTIKRDLKSFLIKLRYVLFPFTNKQKVKELRDWDLFGPLIISLTLTIIMIFKGSLSDSNYIFAANFLLLIFGSFLVTINAKLVGVKFSIFFYISAMGYSLAPFIIAALCNLLIGKLVTRFGILLISAFCYLWAIKSVGVFFGLTILPTRKYLVMYPIFLYYLFFAWFIVLE